jgi:hypothetical protein
MTAKSYHTLTLRVPPEVYERIKAGSQGSVGGFGESMNTYVLRILVNALPPLPVAAGPAFPPTDDLPGITFYSPDSYPRVINGSTFQTLEDHLSYERLFNQVP